MESHTKRENCGKVKKYETKYMQMKQGKVTSKSTEYIIKKLYSTADDEVMLTNQQHPISPVRFTISGITSVDEV